MADNDLIFQIIAQDQYKAQLEEARAAVDKMTQAERDSLALKAPVYEAEGKIASALDQSTTAASKYTAQFEALKQQYAEGKISQDEYVSSLGVLKQKIEEGAQGFSSFQASIVTAQSAIAIAGQAINTVIGTVKQAWDFAKEGAAIERIGAQFNQVASDFGVSGDKLVAAMDKAAHGTVDDEELMQVATRALTQGTITSQDQLVKFTEIARASAIRFGGDTSQALQSILYATEVGAHRQLKATLGVVDFTKSYENLAAQLGKRKQDLTDEEQLQARVNAVLEKGDELVKKVGTSTEDTATKMARFETRGKDLGDRLHALAADAFGPVLDAGADYEKMLDESASGSDRLAAANRILESGFSSQNSALANQLLPSLRELAAKEFDATGISDNLDASTRQAARSAEEAAHKAQQLADAQINVGQGAYAMNGALDETNRTLQRTKEATASAATTMDELKVGMAGAIQNEFTNFNTKQDDLATKAAKVKEELDKLEASQGRVATSTKKHALTAAEATLANLQLAQAQEQLDKENAKGTLTADQITALQEKVALNKEKLTGATHKEIEGNKQLTAASVALKDAQAQLANNTDPMKQAELAVKVEDLKGKLDQATGSVVKYIDNSKRIKELQGQYDEINKEIEANVAAHEKATKTILFGYAEQAIANENLRRGIQGFTEDESRALDALAVKWGLKSQEDVTAMQNIRTAAQNLAKDGSIEEFTSTVGVNLDKVNADYAETQGKISETAQATAGMAAAGIPIPVKADTTQAEKDVDDAKKKITAEPLVLIAKLSITEQAKSVAGDTLAERTAQASKQTDALKGSTQAVTSATDLITNYSKAAIDSTGKLADSTASSIGNVTDKARVKFGDMTTSVINALTNMVGIAAGDFNTVSNYVDRLPTFKEFVYQIVVKGANDIPPVTRGAQYGADFIVPPNPRGGSGDYFPVIAAPMEHVVITPAGKPDTATKAQNITTNNNTYNLYDALAAKQVAEQKRLKQLESVLGAM